MSRWGFGRESAFGLVAQPNEAPVIRRIGCSKSDNMPCMLVRLTQVAGVDPEIISAAYAGTNLSPQEYHYDLIGSDTLRECLLIGPLRTRVDWII